MQNVFNCFSFDFDFSYKTENFKIQELQPEARMTFTLFSFVPQFDRPKLCPVQQLRALYLKRLESLTR